MNIETSIEIHADAATTFAAFTNLRAYPELISAITKIEVLSGDEAGVGTKFKETRVMFGKEASETMEYTVFEPSKRFVLEARSHGSHYVTTHEFAESEGATTVSIRFGATPETFGAKVLSVMFFFMKGSMVKAFQADLSDMKKHLEK